MSYNIEAALETILSTWFVLNKILRYYHTLEILDGEVCLFV